MVKNSFYLLLVLSLVALIVIGGCSKKDLLSPDEAEEIIEELDAIDQEFGGYDTSNENPSEFIEEEEDFEDEEVVDGVSEDPAVQALLDSTTMNVYFVRINWGMLRGDSTVTDITDWSGVASVNKGIIAVIRTIHFEPRTDYIIHPRTDRKTLEWRSATTIHYDGIYLAIIDNDTASNEIDGELSFRTGPFSSTFSFDELDSLKEVYDVDNIGNQVSIISMSKEVIPFAGGFLEGRWIRTKQHGGRFHGRWINSLGTRAGHLRGIWGINRDGGRVFFGKYVGMNGAFRGLLRGHWGYDREEEGTGWFKGNWVNANFNTIGTLNGYWKVGEIGDRKGMFRGRWFKTM